MESCLHVRNMQICQKKALLNPRNWTCSECGTTDGVWMFVCAYKPCAKDLGRQIEHAESVACLSCSNFSCGRSSEGHALKHFKSTKHPLAIEVNQKYVHCYLCNDWVLNDTCNSDIKLVQSMLEQVASQQYHESHTRSGRVIRPAISFMRSESRLEEALSRCADRRDTADTHWRRLLLSKMFNAWKRLVQSEKAKSTCSLVAPASTSPRKVISPGVTGLRNLGNTCYMNAVFQALGNLHLLRETFRHMADNNSGSLFNRQSTVECFQRISTKPPAAPPLKRGRMMSVTGLTGGSGGSSEGMARSPNSEGA